MLAFGLACLAVLVVLTVTPLHIHMAVERETETRARVECSWLFGLVQFDAHPRPERRQKRPEEEQAPKRRKSVRSKFARRFAAGLMNPALRARLVAFLGDVLHALRLRDVRFRARIGLDDPAETGQLWSLLGPLGALLQDRDVWIEPHFNEACLEFEGAARVRVIPAQLLALSVGLLLSPPMLRTLVAR